MNRKVLKTLEYDKIISMLSAEAQSAPGRALCEALVPSSDPAEIEKAQRETSDACARIRLKGDTNFGGAREVSDSLKRLEVGAVLSISELLHIASLLSGAARVKTWGAHPAGDETEPDSLESYFQNIDPLPGEARELNRCILGEDLVADSASPELSRIRRQLRSIDERMHSALSGALNQYREYLMDTVITMRDGSYCLAVKSEFKSRVAGIVHDQSSSGNTIFIEPMAAVRTNNDRRELELAEQREIAEILAGLSRLIAPFVETIREDGRILAHLDFVFAKARLSGKMDASEPRLNTRGFLELKDARHPLIARDKVVPITLKLGDTYDLLIITGPNTGGKTVSLKTAGLLTLMGQAGLHIPAFQGSSIAVFDEVFADIGDEQSIEQSLSTFSGHMKNEVEILNHADARSLCLFDELGAGTDPTEGAALAISILQFLHGMKTRTIATTHYSELKVYALSTPGVENASCEFDVETLRPTYRLLIGVPGKSNAFAISKKLGLPDYIIEDAKTHIEKNDAAFEDLLSKLETDRTEMEKERAEIDSYKKEIEDLKKRYVQVDEQLDERREKILRKAREEAQQILSDAKETADDSIRRINKLTSDAGLMRELEKERTKLRENLKAVDTPRGIQASDGKKKPHRDKPLKLHLGDSVRVLSMNHSAIVSSLPDKNGKLFVRMGILRTQVNVDDIVPIGDDADDGTPKSRQASGNFAPSFSKSVSISPEINLIGLTVDEAIPELDKYLDDAMLAHLSSVRVIHGRGTGALKKGIQNWLRKQTYVKSYKQAEYDDGGDAVTIVTFR